MTVASMESMPEERRPKLCVDGGGEDRLGALHDDVLIHILLGLRCATAAARTSILARRWRHLWALLPELYFSSVTNPQRIHSAIAAHKAPALQELILDGQDASVGPMGAWLPIVARRLSGILVCNYSYPPRSAMARTRTRRRADLELPCFVHATGILLQLAFLRLVLPPSGVFAQLRFLHLFQIRLHGPCQLGGVVSSARCPCLHGLFVDDVRGVGDLAIHSESLREMELCDLHDLVQLTIVASALEKLKVIHCFGPAERQPVTNISAPRLLELVWMDDYDQHSVRLGEMAHLQLLAAHHFTVYGNEEDSSHNRNCALLLQRFERLCTLDICLFCLPDIANDKYLMEEITRLPDVISLELGISTCGHSFGASLFHLIRMCTAIRTLNLQFSVVPEYEEVTVCPSDCVCHQQPRWKTKELVLNCLEEVTISGLRGTEHEIEAVDRLFSWATVLKRMTVNFHDSITENKAEELSQAFVLLTFSRPEIRITCRMPSIL